MEIKTTDEIIVKYYRVGAEKKFTKKWVAVDDLTTFFTWLRDDYSGEYVENYTIDDILERIEKELSEAQNENN